MMIGAELFRQGPRPKAMAAASVVNWIGTFIIALCFESVAVRIYSDTAALPTPITLSVWRDML